MTPDQPALGVLHHHRRVHAEDAAREREAAQDVLGDPSAGVADHVGLAEVQAQHGEDVDAGVHARDDGEVATGPGVRDVGTCGGIGLVGARGVRRSVVMAIARTVTGRTRRPASAAARRNPAPRCWSSVGTGRDRAGQGQPDRERGERCASQHPWRSSTGATGTPAADEAGDQLVPRPGSRRRRATARCSSRTPPEPLVEVEGRQCTEAELVRTGLPEVLLVHHAQRHLAAVGRGEEAVAGRHGAAGVGPGPPAARRRRDRSRWPARRSWRCRGTSLRRWSARPSDGGADPEGGGQPGGQVGDRQRRAGSPVPPSGSSAPDQAW